MSDDHVYEPQNGHGLPHDPFNAIVAPRPIGWISSRDQVGRLNLAPYSFFNAFNYRPPIIGFCSIGRKDSLRNAEETGEFCWNLATEALIDQVNLTSAPAPADVDEFQLAGLPPAPSRLIKAPFVKESPASFECRTTQVVQLRRADGEAVETWMVFGEVVVVRIDRTLLKDGIYDTASGRPLLRGGGPADFFGISHDGLRQKFRPNWPLGS
ncbi:MAG TPA: flavin reductase family protein [Geminicoccus sp.]|uniref:flavin reductase family protein n=1 Tax=Geminicoccus sp. TaxID=2024832 RepID=UPI002E2F617E|nr:flavin reductase family protein [Geminicoccus sp.]HEX2527401.1 flavin reductase family protein [Geminicoccus sp.]